MIYENKKMICSLFSIKFRQDLPYKEEMLYRNDKKRIRNNRAKF